jgi:general secretion pathway protein B
MSSILKALKKLETEKALTEEAAGINVSREILRQQPANRKAVFWLSIAGIVAIAVIAALTALLLAKSPRQQEAKIAPAADLPLKDPALPPGASTVIAAPPTGTGGRAVPSLTTAPEKRDLQPTSPALLPPSLPTAAGRSTTEMPASHASVAVPTQTETGRKPLSPSPSEQTDTSLTLSGIAWNKDSADRLAIINGQPTATGATVSGVVVEEIMPDRVKVNSGGRSFEIFLGKPANSN